MKTIASMIISLVLAGSLYAADPEIAIVEGKVSISALQVPLGRILSLLDKATGLTSEVKPELANRMVSVRFTELPLKDAVQKIFEGQPFNYLYIEGKGVKVTDLAVPGNPTAIPVANTAPVNTPPAAPLAPASVITSPPPPPSNAGAPPSAGPVSQPNPIVITTSSPAPAAPQPSANSNSAVTVPGQLPPPIGSNNPFGNPAAAPAAPAAPTPTPPVNTGPPPANVYTAAPAAPPTQPPSAGTLGSSVTPGVIK